MQFVTEYLIGPMSMGAGPGTSYRVGSIAAPPRYLTYRDEFDMEVIVPMPEKKVPEE